MKHSKSKTIQRVISLMVILTLIFLGANYFQSLENAMAQLNVHGSYIDSWIESAMLFWPLSYLLGTILLIIFSKAISWGNIPESFFHFWRQKTIVLLIILLDLLFLYFGISFIEEEWQNIPLFSSIGLLTIFMIGLLLEIIFIFVPRKD